MRHGVNCMLFIYLRTKSRKSSRWRRSLGKIPKTAMWKKRFCLKKSMGFRTVLIWTRVIINTNRMGNILVKLNQKLQWETRSHRLWPISRGSRRTRRLRSWLVMSQNQSSRGNCLQVRKNKTCTTFRNISAVSRRNRLTKEAFLIKKQTAQVVQSAW